MWILRLFLFLIVVFDFNKGVIEICSISVLCLCVSLNFFCDLIKSGGFEKWFCGLLVINYYLELIFIILY